MTGFRVTVEADLAGMSLRHECDDGNRPCHRQELFRTDSVRIEAWGLFCGTVYRGEVSDPETAGKKMGELHAKGERDELRRLMRHVVGPCHIVIMDTQVVDLWASPASSGFAYGTVPRDACESARRDILCSNVEGWFYEQWRLRVPDSQLDPSRALNAVVAHQSSQRPPFRGLFHDTYRCPPGCCLRISEGTTEVDAYIIQSKEDINRTDLVTGSPTSQEQAFCAALDGVVRLYSAHLPGFAQRVKLSFSGGIDSSLLLFAFKDVLPDDAAFYKDYDFSSECAMAQRVARQAGLRLNVVRKSAQTFDAGFVKKKAGAGLGTVLGLQYLQHNFCFHGIPSNSDNTEYVITGQNADMLIHVDGFAPHSRVGGMARVRNLVGSANKRIYYTYPFYERKQAARFWPFCVPRECWRKSIQQFVMPSIIGTLEHSVPFDQDSAHVPHAVDRRHFSDYRCKEFWDPVSVQFAQLYGAECIQTSFAATNPRTANHMVRMTRWFRSIGNVQQQFENCGCSEDINILTPFSEGPVASVLLKWQLGLADALIVKRFSQRYIKKKGGCSYASLRRAAGTKGVMKQCILAMPGGKQIARYMKRAQGQESAEHVKSTGDDNLAKLRALIADDDGHIPDLLCDLVPPGWQRDYLAKSYERLRSARSERELSKPEQMELCRLVNLHVMLEPCVTKRPEASQSTQNAGGSAEGGMA